MNKLNRVIPNLCFIFLSMLLGAVNANNEATVPEYLNSSFLGTYEGELQVVIAPDAFKNKNLNLEYRVVIEAEKTTLFIKAPKEEWGQAGSGPHIIDNPQVVTAFFNDRAGFIEYWSISLIRTAKDSAQAYIMRTVNHFEMKPENEMHHFYMVSEGILKSTHNK